MGHWFFWKKGDFYFENSKFFSLEFWLSSFFFPPRFLLFATLFLKFWCSPVIIFSLKIPNSFPEFIFSLIFFQTFSLEFWLFSEFWPFKDGFPQHFSFLFRTTFVFHASPTHKFHVTLLLCTYYFLSWFLLSITIIATIPVGSGEVWHLVPSHFSPFSLFSVFLPPAEQQLWRQSNRFRKAKNWMIPQPRQILKTSQLSRLFAVFPERRFTRSVLGPTFQTKVICFAQKFDER